jgi:lipopolysaccharide transport protein LptA
MHRANNYAFLKEVDADFISEKTGNIVNTQSDFGTSYLDKRVIDLKGNVMIHSKRGYLFTMDTLSYDGKTHFFTTDDLVTIKGPIIRSPAMILRGTGLNGNIDEEHFLLRKNVTAEKKLKSSDWLRIQSSKGEFFTEKQEAIFVGKVISQMPKLGLKSDKLEVNMGEEESIRASGNVSLKRKDTTGKAEVVYMEMDSNKIILEGQAEVISRNNLITGKRITLYSDEERIEVEEAQGKIKR